METVKSKFPRIRAYATIAGLVGYFVYSQATGNPFLYILVVLYGALMAAWEAPTHHWNQTIMYQQFMKTGHRLWSRNFWDMNESWKYRPKLFGYELPWFDVFHISKSLRLLTVAAMLLTVKSITPVGALIYCLTMMESFNLFYKNIFLTKQFRQWN